LGGNVGHQVDMVLADPDMDEERKSERAESLKNGWQGLHDRAIEAGGLHIIGTERHESRRVDNQLRGRSGRQGDPGTTRFYLCLEDPLMRIFGSDRLGGLMQKLGMKEGEAIEHPWVTKSIENAQRKVESRNFDIRKQLLEYDDVANEQRKIIYQQRNAFMDADNVSEEIQLLREDVLDAVLADHTPAGVMEEEWDVPGLESALQRVFGLEAPVEQWLELDKRLNYEGLRSKVMGLVQTSYAEKEALMGSEMARHFEKSIMLQVLDSQWKDHLASMDHLREGIHLRGYAQKNPKQEYKKESLAMFNSMLARMREEVISTLSRLHVSPAAETMDWDALARAAAPQHLQFSHPDFAAEPGAENSGLTALAGGVLGEQLTDSSTHSSAQSPLIADDKIGRNQPCPCGSGKKYKHCHGRLQ